MNAIERIAEKIVPALLLAIIGALFTMYMDIQFLKATAIDYKQRADTVHLKFEEETRANREALIKLDAR